MIVWSRAATKRTSWRRRSQLIERNFTQGYEGLAYIERNQDGIETQLCASICGFFYLERLWSKFLRGGVRWGPAISDIRLGAHDVVWGHLLLLSHPPYQLTVSLIL